MGGQEEKPKDINSEDAFVESPDMDMDKEETLIDTPPDEDKLEVFRQLRKKEKEMEGVMKEIIRYLLFLCLLSLVAYGNRDRNAFHVRKSISTLLVEASYTQTAPFDGVSETRSSSTCVGEPYQQTGGGVCRSA